MTRVLIVDGMSVFKTAVFGVTSLDNGFVYNFFTQLTSVTRKMGDIKGIVVCWEGGHDFRAKLFPDYKKDRIPSSGSLRNQREMLKEMLRAVGIPQVHAPGFEADDVGAHLSRELNVPAVLMSNDQDWLQLVRPGISIWQRAKGSKPKANQRMLITHENFADATGWPTTTDFLRAKCIQGDDSDSIPGLDGVGPVSILNYFCGRDRHTARSQKIEEFMSSETYARNMLLMDLNTPKPELTSLLVWDYGEKSEARTVQLLKDYGFASIIKKFPEWWETYQAASL